MRLIAPVRSGYELIKTAVTNADGRCDAPLLEGAALLAAATGWCSRAGAYFRRLGAPLADPPFVDEVTLDFGDRRRRRALPRAAARLAVELLDVPRQLSAS